MATVSPSRVSIEASSPAFRRRETQPGDTDHGIRRLRQRSARAAGASAPASSRWSVASCSAMISTTSRSDTTSSTYIRGRSTRLRRGPVDRPRCRRTACRAAGHDGGEPPGGGDSRSTRPICTSGQARPTCGEPCTFWPWRRAGTSRGAGSRLGRLLPCRPPTAARPASSPCWPRTSCTIRSTLAECNSIRACWRHTSRATIATLVLRQRTPSG